MNKYLIVSCMVAMSSIVGCKPYDKPAFIEVSQNETAFVIPMEGETGKQDAFASAEILEQKKVATKRIQIPHRWISEGRTWWNGRYIDTISVIKVNRTPVTKTWSPDNNATKQLEAESRDSIGVKSGFTLTAFIPEEKTHLFLYRYKDKGLEEILETQVFNSIQAIYTELCTKYDLFDLRSKKQEITDEIRKRVIPFYKEWGIEIAEDMGIVGGLVYDNPEIQQAIDNVFVAQTKQKGNEALRDAQNAENERQKSIAENEANIAAIRAKGEAEAIAMRAKAIADAGQAYIGIETLKVMSQFAEKWNGQTPTFMGQMPPMMFDMQKVMK